jgi:hypothetical protein
MPLNFHIPLPGPFTYSARVTPDLRPVARTIGEIARAGQATTRPGASRRMPPRGELRTADYVVRGVLFGLLLLPVEWWLLELWI